MGLFRKAPPDPDETGPARRLHIGAGRESIPGWINIDNQGLPGVDQVLDVRQGLPFADVASIFTGPCKTAYTTLERKCGEDLSKYEAQCKGSAYTFEGPIKVQCVSGGVTA